MLRENAKKIIYCLISGVIFIILCFLSAQSLFTEVKLDDGERKYFVASNKLLIILAFFLLLAFFYVWHKYIKLSDKTVKKIIMIMAAANFLFILASQNIPRSDQDVILKCASEILQGNYKRLERGNYLYMCPHQRGLVLFCYFLAKFFGELNFLVFQMINLAAVGLTYYLFYYYLENYETDKRKDEIIAGVMLFFPIMLYTNYVYGLLIGLSCASCAMLYQQMYFKKRDIRHLLLSVLLIALAYCFKTNFAIFAIGILLLYFVDAWENRKSVIGIAGVIAALILMNGIINKGLSIATDGASDDSGKIPMIAYLVMGISNEEDSYGWFNSYNWSVYTNNDYDYEKTKAACMEDLETETQYWMDEPGKAVDFFQKKITSIWCEASFGSFYETRIDYQTVLRNHSHLYNDMFSYTGKLHRIIGLFLEVYQNVVYLGVILYIIYSWKDHALLKLSGLIVFLGGFIFHLFWEAKSSYTFVYFVLLIPYAVTGLGKCFDKVSADVRKKGISSLKSVIPFLAGFAVLVLGGGVLQISKDSETWNLFLAEHRFIDEGCYSLQAQSADTICHVGENDEWLLSIDMSYVWKYELTDIYKKSHLSVVDGEICMLPDEEAREREDIDVDSAKWRFERTGGAYCIRWWLDMNQVITYDAERGTVFLSNYEEGNPNQLWELRE